MVRHHSIRKVAVKLGQHAVARTEIPRWWWKAVSPLVPLRHGYLKSYSRFLSSGGRIDPNGIIVVSIWANQMLRVLPSRTYQDVTTTLCKGLDISTLLLRVSKAAVGSEKSSNRKIYLAWRTRVISAVLHPLPFYKVQYACTSISDLIDLEHGYSSVRLVIAMDF